MSEDLGSARGSVEINTLPALAALAHLRKSSAATVGSLNTIGRAAILAGTGMVSVGAGIVAVFALAVKKAAEIDKKISYIAGITNVSTEEMGELRKVIVRLGQDSAYTAAEVADGFTELAKAGATNQQMIGGMGKAMITLGQAADIPLDKAASALVSIASTFDLTAKESARIADVMSGAANASIISVEDMAVSFKYAGGVAANLGVTLEDTATAIAILGNAGIRGSTAGTSLRRIFLQLTPRTEKAAEAMKALGIITKDGSNKFYDAQGNAKSLAEITEILRTSTEGLTAEMRQKAFATIFGDRAINSAIALAKGGSKEFERMKAVLGDTTAEEVAAKRLDNLAGSWEILKGTIDSALINAGTPAQKPLQDLVESITKLVNVFNNLSPATQKMIVQFALVVAGVFLISGAFLIFFGTLLRAYAVLIQLANAFKVFKRFAGPLKGLLKGLWLVTKLLSKGLLLLGKALLFVGKAFLRMALMMFANPVGLIVLAVIALVIALVLLYKRSERVRNIIDAVGRALKTAFFAMVDFFKRIPGYASAAWNGIVNFFQGIPGFFGNLFTQAGEAIASFFTDLPRRLGFVIGFLIGTYVRVWLDVMSFIVNIVGNAISAVVGFFIALPGNIWDALVSVFNTVVGWGASLISGAINIGTRFYHGIVDFFQRLPGRIASLTVAIYNRVRSWGTSLVNNARSTGANFLNGVVSFVQNLPGRIADFVTRTYNQVVSLGARIVAAGRDWGTRLFNGVVGAIQGLPGRIGGILGRVIDAFTGLIRRGFDAARNFAGGLWEGFKEGLGINSPSFIEKQMFAIEATGEESISSLARQVKTLQRLAAGVPDLNAATAASRALYSSPSAPARAAKAAASSDSPLADRQVIVNNYNPIAEPSSVTTVRVANRLALLEA